MPAKLITTAMKCPDDLVVCLEYIDSKGVKTRRVVSPIRFVSGTSFLGLCLSRCEPRRFQLDRCSNLRLARAADFVMPVEITTLGSQEAPLAAAS